MVAEEGRPAVGGECALEPQHGREELVRRARPNRFQNGVGHLEGEVCVQLVRVVGEQRARAVPHLADGERGGRDAVDIGGVVAQESVGAGGARQPIALFHEVGNSVEAKPVHAEVLEPEAGHMLRLLAHGRRLVVQVRHPLPEHAVVVLVTHRGAVPDHLTPGTLQMGIRARPAEPRAIRRVGVAQRLLEEWVLPGNVVQDHVHQHADAVPVRRGYQALEVLVGSVLRVDAVVVRHVVAVITRRLGQRHQPEAAGAEALDVGQLEDEALQVPDAVAVAVVKRAHEDFVADGAAQPALRAAGGGARGDAESAEPGGAPLPPMQKPSLNL